MPMQLMGTMKNAVDKLMQGGGPFGPGVPQAGMSNTMASGEHRGYRPGVPGTAQQSAVSDQTGKQSAQAVDAQPQIAYDAGGYAYSQYGQPQQAAPAEEKGFGGMLDKLLGGRRARRAQRDAQNAYADMYQMSGQQAADPYLAQQYAYSQQMTGFAQASGYGQTGYAQNPYQQSAYGQGQSYAAPYVQPYQNTGYSQAQQPYQSTGYSQAQQPYQGTGYGQAQQPYQGTGYNQAQQPYQALGYAQSGGANAQPAGFQPSYTGQQNVVYAAQNQPQQGDYASQGRPVWGGNEGSQTPFGAAQPYVPQNGGARSRRAGRGRNEEAAAPANNVVYMNPQNFVDENGAAYRMVLRLTQPLSTAKCYRIIEFMRNGETVLVNTELIQGDQELTRCLDLIYGACYALNCTCTRVSKGCLYAISPRDVNVQSYASLESMNQADVATRWPGSDPSNPRDKSWNGKMRQGETPDNSYRPYGAGRNTAGGEYFY